MSDYQNIAESTALCILVACINIHSTWISLIHDVLAQLTVLTGIYLLHVHVGAFLYRSTCFKYLEGEVFLSNVKSLVMFCTESSHLLAEVPIVRFQWCSTLLLIC